MLGFSLRCLRRTPQFRQRPSSNKKSSPSSERFLLMSRLLYTSSRRRVSTSNSPHPSAPVGRSNLSSLPSCASSCSLSQSPIHRRQRVVSGVQPTGQLHLGNYLGAIRQWKLLQDRYDNFFFVVDLHAVTVKHDPKRLAHSTVETVAMYLAAGIDPDKSRIFVQSHVGGLHAEMAWLLNCVTPMSWLERMIQYKEKTKAARQGGEHGSVGLFDYPVLMTADILLYGSDLIPVGEDQIQHLELARDIARRFNDQFASDEADRIFREPQALLAGSGSGVGCRVMSLEDGMCKMSKSAESDMSRINLIDSADVIRRKIKQAKTDCEPGLAYDDPRRPECRNLLRIYQALTGMTREEITRDVSTSDMTWGKFKPMLTEAVIEHLTPIQTKYNQLITDKTYLHQVLEDGRLKATEEAEKTLKAAKRAMGFTLPEDLLN